MITVHIKTFEAERGWGAYIHDIENRIREYSCQVSNKLLISGIPITDADLFEACCRSWKVAEYGMPFKYGDDDTAAGVAFNNLLQRFVTKGLT